MYSLRVPRDTEATRRRLLDAATREFAAHGVAGARIDRIADDAGCSKGLIYTYWGNKESLFAAVFDQVVAVTVGHVPNDCEDLGDWAGRLFDEYERRPQVARLLSWSRLEHDGRFGSVAQAIERAAATIKQGQAEGKITPAFEPIDLVLLCQHIAATWALSPGERHREVVVEAVRRLARP